AVGADVALLVDPEGTPSGLQLIRCETLGHISTRGFVDFKEQALPLLSRRFDVRVVRRPIVAVSVRTLESYLGALRMLHDPRGGGGARAGGAVADPRGLAGYRAHHHAGR